MVFACGKDPQTTVDKYPNSMFVLAMQTLGVQCSCVAHLFKRRSAIISKWWKKLWRETTRCYCPNNSSPSLEYQQLSTTINNYQHSGISTYINHGWKMLKAFLMVVVKTIQQPDSRQEADRCNSKPSPGSSPLPQVDMTRRRITRLSRAAGNRSGWSPSRGNTLRKP